MTRREIKKALKTCMKKMEITEDWDTSNYDNDKSAYYMSVYLGSFLDLDPCGRYHHVLSPNGIQKRCERFWDNLELCANELDCWIESGESDGLDIFLCRNATTKEIEDYKKWSR
jgi:hypothetical protein